MIRWKTAKKDKFNANITEVDGIKFKSRKEARYYNELKIRKMAGEVSFFLRQVPFDLGGGVRHFLDFVEFWANGEVKFIEVKGYDTPQGKMKRKLIESMYPIKIEVVK